MLRNKLYTIVEKEPEDSGIHIYGTYKTISSAKKDMIETYVNGKLRVYRSDCNCVTDEIKTGQFKYLNSDMEYVLDEIKDLSDCEYEKYFDANLRKPLKRNMIKYVKKIIKISKKKLKHTFSYGDIPFECIMDFDDINDIDSYSPEVFGVYKIRQKK